MIGGNRRMLKKVDSLMYEDGMGLSAWVDGKRAADRQPRAHAQP